jgi:hypothetical protein
VRIMTSALVAANGATSHLSHRTLVLGVGLALGVLIVIAALPLILKRVHPNRYFGLVTLRHRSRTTWYTANRFLGITLLLAGLVTILVTVIIWLAKPSSLAGSNKKLAAVEAGIVIVPAAIAYVVSAFRYRNR